jgi:hypothetical protein
MARDRALAGGTGEHAAYSVQFQFGHAHRLFCDGQRQAYRQPGTAAFVGDSKETGGTAMSVAVQSCSPDNTKRPAFQPSRPGPRSPTPVMKACTASARVIDALVSRSRNFWPFCLVRDS